MAERIVFTTHLHEPEERRRDGVSWWLLALMLLCVILAFWAGL